jgi:maltose/moltooligosaccharide transporter
MSNPSFPWRQTFILGFGFFGISIIWPIFNSFIPPMLEDLGLAAGVIGFLVRNQTALLLLLAVMGGFWALVNINSLPMVYDLGGEERIGALTGLYYFASSAAITGPILAGTLIDLTGKNHAIVWLFSAVFIAMAGGLMLRVRPRPPVISA